ncbi:hypothetical protein AAFF39_00155 [Lactococcus garvieae]
MAIIHLDFSLPKDFLSQKKRPLFSKISFNLLTTILSSFFIIWVYFWSEDPNRSGVIPRKYAFFSEGGVSEKQISEFKHFIVEFIPSAPVMPFVMAIVT